LRFGFEVYRLSIEYEALILQPNLVMDSFLIHWRVTHRLEHLVIAFCGCRWSAA